VTGLANVVGTYTTSSALSRVQSPILETAVIEQTKIKAIIM